MTDKILHPGTDNFFLLAGPCVIEGERMALDIAETIAPLAAELNIPYIFKGSYRRPIARASTLYRYRRPRSSRCLEKIRNTLGIPVVTDIHSADEAMMASDFDVDVLQIPAFLCRRTDLLVAAAKTGRAVNIKKGQFLSPESMLFCRR